jgi:catechol 2,3-dioxygenase-like lactoylglutathione lyase family enzyme
MLETVDGVILAVRDAEAATKRFGELFGAQLGQVNETDLGAKIASLQCGRDFVHVAEPTGPGPIADHIERWGEGIVGVVFSTRDIDAVASTLERNGVRAHNSDGAIRLDSAQTHGLLTVVMSYREREPEGALSFLYEVTHLVHDWKAVSEFWTKAFGLDGAKFSPISSKQYGYDGMLTLFDPPDKLDRVEVVTPYGDGAMNRFFTKRGEGPYMFFAETHDRDALLKRLDAAGARYATGKDPNSSVFVHPSATHGVLIGVSPTDQAWVWSGRPELAGT